MRGYLAGPLVRRTDSLTLALIVSDPGLSQEIRGCIHEFPMHFAFEIPSLRSHRGMLARLHSDGVNVVVVELDTLAGDFESGIRDIKAAAPECEILAVGKSAQADTILRAFRAGCTDYLCAPLRRPMIAALARIEARREKKKPGVPGGAILGFLSAKGGCGATTVACNVAPEIQRLTGARTLLADLDVKAGMVAFTMKTDARHDVVEAMRNTDRLDSSYWRALVVNRSGLEVAAAPALGTAVPLPPAGTVMDTIRFLRSEYRTVLVDLGSGLNRFMQPVLDELDRLYLVATPDALALEKARQIAEYFQEQRSPRVDTRLILNRVPLNRPDLTVPDAADRVGLPVCCEIASDYRELYGASINGRLAGPRTRAGRDFARAARTILHGADRTEEPTFWSLAGNWLRTASGLMRSSPLE